MSDHKHEFARLMEEVRAGSEEAVRRLLNDYGRYIQRVVRRRLDHRLRSRFDSEDFVQAVWASFFRCRDQLAAFEGADELAAWLARLAGNKVIDQHRRHLDSEKRDITREEPLLFDDDQPATMELVSHDPSPSQVAMAQEHQEQIVAGQPEHYRRMVELRATGHSLAEIAESLGLNEGHVRRVLRRLRRRAEGPPPAAESP